MMEKNGEIKPDITPPETGDTAKTAAARRKQPANPEAELEAIRELDGDFRNLAAKATRKSLQ